MVYVGYCDGGSFTGDSVRQFENHTLYFKGQRIISSLLLDLGNLGANNASNIIVAGESAGALSALIHVDKFKQKFHKSSVVGLIDSGFSIHWIRLFVIIILPCSGYLIL